jgi:signal transduction histidine kinase
LSLHLLRSQDEERKRIGRDLHDSLGQCLAMLKINLDSIQMALPSSETKVLARVAQCLEVSDEAIREVRTIAYLLYPPMLEELGLNSAIPWYLEGFSERSQIKTTFEVDSNLPRLPRAAELALFRVLQESLTNVHRHSESETATVRLFEENGVVVLEIEDEGKGFPKGVLELNDDDMPSSFGVGLRGTNERMRELGGMIELRVANKGAIVRAVVPRDQSAIEGREPSGEKRDSAA